MSKKIWNRIFKTKSTNKTTGISKKTRLPTTPTFSSAVENQLSFYEDFHNCCQQQQKQSPIKEKPYQNPTATAAQSSSNKSQSKFTKVVNSLTLKRNSKENQNSNQLNTSSTGGDTNHQDGNNYSAEETLSINISTMKKIGTPTTTILNQPSDYTIEHSEEPISLELIACPTCSRTFVRETLEKHVRICEKMTIRKRKIFDSSRQRREGTELASYPLAKNYGLPAFKHERGISPKPIQAALPVLSPKKPPEEPNKPFTNSKYVNQITSKKLPSPFKTTNNLWETSSGQLNAVPKARSRPIAVTKRIQPPPAEPCPYCERCFGIKAYDRHVEWCKEKALIASIKHQNSNTQVAAKERLEARIKYRAPCLKTKRAVNRDKYSYQNDENFDMQSSMEENHQTALMTSSMTSSFISDSVVSGNYDPFISAKRQLEELCSPSSPAERRLSPTMSVASPKTPVKLQKSETLNKMTTSFTSRGSLTNPRCVVTTPKSNFHRTSSLRAPRKSPLPTSSRPIFFPSSQKQRPTIQRGLSDEGPISSNFLKPEEYDEMPVRAVCVNDFAISNTHKVIRRDSSAACNRKILRLNLLVEGQSSKHVSPTPSKSNILKTDSLAVFLKHENEAKRSDNSVVNSKELKDKNNALSKQNSAKSINSTDDKVSVTRNPDGCQISDHSSNSIGNLISLKLEPIARPVRDSQNISLSARQCPSAVDSIKARSSIKLNSLFGTAIDGDYIDPKLINICDNLPIEPVNDLTSNTSSPTSFSGVADGDVKKLDLTSYSRPNQPRNEKDMLAKPLPHTTTINKSSSNSNRSSSGDTRNQLKRKIRLGRNQFLYDASPEALDNDADDEGNNRSFEHDIRKPVEKTALYSTLAHATTDTAPNIPPFSPSTFNEFDFQEFLSAFDNDREQFPSLFKDCREFLMNRSTLSKRSNIDNMSSYSSPKEILDDSNRKYEQDVELNLDSDENKNRGEIFISIETDQNENDPHPKNDPLIAANPSAQIEEVKIDDNKFQRIEDNEAGGDLSHRVEDEESDNQLRMRRMNFMNDFPNVRLNNAKNLIQQMHEDFHDIHAVAVVGVAEDLNCNNLGQNTESSLHPVDSDEISSIECFPVRSNGPAGGGGGGPVQSKQSADSAYGSLSRQSPIPDINTNYRGNVSHRAKPTSALQDLPKTQQSAFQYLTSISHKYTNPSNIDVYKYQCRNFSSSSGSDNSLPPEGAIRGSKNLSSARHDQQSTMKEFKRAFHRYPLSVTSSLENKNKSTNSTGSMSNSNSTLTSTTSNVKISKFCHECGSKFLLDQAKFCMDCGVRRIVLK